MFTLHTQPRSRWPQQIQLFSVRWFYFICFVYVTVACSPPTTQHNIPQSLVFLFGVVFLLLLCVSDANRPDWCIRNKRNKQQTTTHNRTWWERWYFTRLFSFSHYFVVVRCEMILVEEKSRYYSVHGSLINFNWWNWIGYTKPKTPAFFVVCVLCMCECVRSSSSLMKSRARDVCIVPNAVFPAYLASNINIHMRELLCVYTLPLCVVCMCWVCSTQYVWASSKPFPLLSMSALFFLFFLQTMQYIVVQTACRCMKGRMGEWLWICFTAAEPMPLHHAYIYACLATSTERRRRLTVEFKFEYSRLVWMKKLNESIYVLVYGTNVWNERYSSTC